MWGALAISAPEASNTAQEKSRRSLMLTEAAVRSRANPIRSAIDMNRLENSSSDTGSGSRVVIGLRAGGSLRVSNNSPRGRTSAIQPASTIVPEIRSSITAGPNILLPYRNESR